MTTREGRTDHAMSFFLNDVPVHQGRRTHRYVGALTRGLALFGAASLVLVCVGCGTPGQRRGRVDGAAAQIIKEKQIAALGRAEPFTIERPAETLRRRLLIAQGLPYSGPASLGIHDLAPVEHWPNDDYFSPEESPPGASLDWNGEDPLFLTLNDALQVAARSSREYQTRKEDVYRAALRLELERDVFRNTFAGASDGLFTWDETGDNAIRGISGSFIAGLARRFKNGIDLSTRIGLDVAKLLVNDEPFSKSLFADSSISIPLLRGAGRHIAAEPLTQAERNAVYAIYEFERFKRTFVVGIATEYLNVLQSADEIVNGEQNYRGLVQSGRRARRLSDAGRLSPIQVDQATQDELRARDRWVRSLQSLERGLDQFKITLGLPTDAEITLDGEELNRLTERSESVTEADRIRYAEEEIPPAGAPIILTEPSREGGGPLEIDQEEAIRLALENRLDLKIAEGDVYDAQRGVVVAADRLRAELTLLGRADLGESRSIGSADQPDATSLDFDEGFYSALLSLDLPLERTAETVAYRESLISLERSVRNMQDLEDRIKLGIRNNLRTLLSTREGIRIQALSVTVADRRVKSSNLYLQAGRVEIRDLLEAQEALLSAQNSLTSALVDYRVAELELQRDLGVLEVDHEGIWREYSPQETERD